MIQPATRRAGVVFLITVWFCWGFSYPATSLALQSIDVWTARAAIMAIAGALLLVVARVASDSIRVPRRLWRDLVIAALCNMTVFQIGMTFGVDLFSPGRTVVMVYTMPLWAMLFAWPLLRERPTLLQIAALVLGLAGLAVLMSQEFTGLPDAWLGAGCTLIAAIAFGLGTVWMKRVDWTVNPTVIAGWQLLIGTVPVIMICPVVATLPEAGAISWASWGGLAFNILFANVIAYIAWFRVIPVFPAIVSGLGTLAVPVVGVMASSLLPDETLGWQELAALGLILAALILNLRAARSSQP